MGDLAEELAQLVGDLRSVMEDAALRGVREEVAPLQAPAPADWSAIAQGARDAPALSSKRLQDVRAELGDCRRCELGSHRGTLVFGVGDPEADLMVIGEGPGEEEDRRGEPFVGPAGQMLDKMLQHVIGLPRSAVYITNVVKCRPPRNRNPSPRETAACAPFLAAQIAAVAPRVCLVLGSVAFKALFQTDQGITRARGTWRELQGIPVMSTFHPAYLLREPKKKRETFEDLKELRTRYDALGGRR